MAGLPALAHSLALGKEASAWTMIPLVSVAVYMVHAVHRCVSTFLFSLNGHPKKQHTYTLYLRRLKSPTAVMLQGDETGNVFIQEYNLLTDLLFPKLDVRAMKTLQEDIPMISKQEALHAKMHFDGKAERKRLEHGMNQWAWFVCIADFFLLRCGEEIGNAMVGYIEATSEIWAYLEMELPFVRGFMSNEYAYHAMEESEHGLLTTQYLRTRVHALTPLLLAPVGFALYTVYFLVPPMMVLVMNPLLLLQPKAYKELVLYYGTFVPTYLATLGACILFWILPFHLNHDIHCRIYQYFCSVVKERGIEFEVVGQETYMMEGNVVKVIAANSGE